MVAATKSRSRIGEIMRGGAIPAIPRRGETGEQAVARVQAKHPGKKVIDPPADKPGSSLALSYARLFGTAQPARFLGKGLREVPSFQKVDIDLTNIDYEEVSNPMGPVPEDWQIEEKLADVKYKRGALDGQYILHKTKSDRILESEVIGRRWVCNYPGEVYFNEGINWGGKRLKLEPQFAGLSEEVMDRYTVSAMQTMPILFPGSRGDQLMPVARAALKQLTMVDYNPTRLLWRMASLYIATKLVEDQGRAVTIESADDMPELQYVNSLADASNMLTHAVMDQAQYLYIEAPKYNVDPKVMEIYQLLMSAKVRFVHTENMAYPNILNIWPQIPNTHVMIYGTERITTAITQISSGQVALAIDAYIQQYGVEKEFLEILDNVAVMALRPKGDSVFCGHTEVLMALPKSQLEPAAMGPMLATIRHWERKNPTLVFPRFSNLMWNGHARYLMWGLAHKQTLMRMGADLGLHTIIDDDSVAAMVQVYGSQAHSNGAQVIASRMLEGFGWSDALGRILVTTIGKTLSRMSGGSRATFVTPLIANDTVQWEEALPYVKKMPADAAIAAIMYPPKTQMMIPTNMWISAKYVINSVTTAEAMYALRYYADSIMGCSRVAHGTGEARYREILVRTNYRDTLADNQFHVSETQHAEGFRIVAKIETATNALNAFCVTQEADKYRWFMEDYVFFPSNLPDMQEKPDYEPQRNMDAIGEERGAAESGVVRLEELQRLERLKLTTSASEIASQKAKPDPFKEMKLRWRETIGEMKPVVPTDMMEVKARQVCEKLGFEPEWISPLRELRRTEKLNPINFANIAPGLAQNMQASLKMLDVRDYPEYALDRTDMDITLRNMASLIRMGIRYAPPGMSQLDLAGMASGLDVMATAIAATGEMISIYDCKTITGKDPPKFVTTELYEEASKLGVRVADIINAPSEEWLKNEMEAAAAHAESLAREYVSAAEEEAREKEFTKVEKAREEIVAEGSGVTAPQEKPMVDVAKPPTEPEQEIQVAETHEEEKVTLSKVEDTATQSDFGSTAVLPGNGDTDQQPENGSAGSAEASGGSPLETTFEASRETE
jgi:hypothetical protein